jgi:diaminopimelate epimerase
MNPPAAAIPFVKANACGNDFLIIDGTVAPVDLAAFTRRICDRYQGVGADGVQWLFPSRTADICARIFNADGSEAEVSGNGTRCVAAYLCSERVRERIQIQTAAGVKACTLTSRSEQEFEFEVAMGEPQVGNELPIPLATRRVCGILVSMGNPHYVVLEEKFPAEWQAEAAGIAQHPHFKQGINVEFVVIQDKANIAARFYERGVGETQSSGTGSCAAAVACIAQGKSESPVRVHAQGGTQTVRWDQQVFLRGSARLVCRGEFFI